MKLLTVLLFALSALLLLDAYRRLPARPSSHAVLPCECSSVKRDLSCYCEPGP